MSKLKIGDKVYSSKSLWSNEIGTVSGVVEMNDGKDLLIHVIFPETEKHYAYQQSFYEKDLINTVMSKTLEEIIGNTHENK